MKLIPPATATRSVGIAVATFLLLGTTACSEDEPGSAQPREKVTAATAGQTPEEVAQRFLLAFSAKDAEGLCDVVLENGAPFPAEERGTCVERFELDFAPADAHDEAGGADPGHSGEDQAHFEEQLEALRASAEEGPTSVSDEVDGQVEVTYPMADAPLVVTLQKFKGSWYVAGTR